MIRQQQDGINRSTAEGTNSRIAAATGCSLYKFTWKSWLGDSKNEGDFYQQSPFFTLKASLEEGLIITSKWSFKTAYALLFMKYHELVFESSYLSLNLTRDLNDSFFCIITALEKVELSRNKAFSCSTLLTIATEKRFKHFFLSRASSSNKTCLDPLS